MNDNSYTLFLISIYLFLPKTIRRSSPNPLIVVRVQWAKEQRTEQKKTRNHKRTLTKQPVNSIKCSELIATDIATDATSSTPPTSAPLADRRAAHTLETVEELCVM